MMNKRIEELVKQATTRERVVGLNPYTFESELKEPPMFCDVFSKEKFAELIVLEMCDMMSQCADDCIMEDASETNWGYISQLQDWIDCFKEHFEIK